MNKHIKKVAVLGSGVMGSQIACHFANIGLEVLLLDIVPTDLSEKDQSNPAFRNRLVNESLKKASKMNPAPLYEPNMIRQINTGNFDDDFQKISDCDWIIEVVIERLDIKKKIFDQVEKYRKPGSLVSSNTSGIPIHLMSEGRSDDFQEHFCGTHFFNPPRYLKLFEVIPGPKTKQEVLDFFMHYGDLFLGKQTVQAKDTPAFIANRVGVFSMMAVLHIMDEFELHVEDVDLLTGTLIGHPKSATFRTADVVGIDTLAKVANGIKENCPNDEQRDYFTLPDYIDYMLQHDMLGAKSGQGFYKKVKNEDGSSEILTLDLKTKEYRNKIRPNIPSVTLAKPIDNLRERLVTLNKASDKGGQFLRKMNHLIFQYVSLRIPEIANNLYQIDEAMKAGFGWHLGPFEIWDTLGVEQTVKEMKEAGMNPAPWVDDMLQQGITSFYHRPTGKIESYMIDDKRYAEIPGSSSCIVLDTYREQKPVFSNNGATLHDIGDGVLCLEFHTKMNSLGSDVIQAIRKSIDIAEEQSWKGLVIGNDAENFSAGANLAMILMTAVEQEFDELNFMIKAFQDTMMRVRYSSIPVVTAPHGLALGGGCEMSLHADTVRAAAETYTGLVEVGVGVIPAGGGTKEMAKRVANSLRTGDVIINRLQEVFVNIATGKVATSAYEAMEMQYLRKGVDSITVNNQRLIAFAKQDVLSMYEQGYTQPVQKRILVQGKSALGSLKVGTHSFRLGNYATDHDVLIANKLAYVLCGGDLSGPQEVSEQYLLDLEREAFLSLCGTKKTLQRIEHMLKTGKPLRN